jgi:arginine-tRNA-protein transferase
VNSDRSREPFGEFFVEASVAPRQMDRLWAEGWRHFGPFFFRRYVMEYDSELKTVQPLRIVLDRFSPTKSQRRILRRNGDVACEISHTALQPEHHRLFAAHVARFRFNIPPDLESFLGSDPELAPCANLTFSVRLGGRLVAASFLDLGQAAVSSVYAIFDPAESRRSLGIFTMLKEIEYGRERGCRFYYPGYACHESSPYDYKKQFAATEWYDWREGWHPLTRRGGP